MKALSFLGTRKYETVTYIWQERERETHLFPEAVTCIFQPERLIVFVTPQAKGHENCRTLCERLGTMVQLVDIPEGRSEAELWQIFEACADVVSEGEEVLLDVTHAFPSLPLIIFTVAAYLRRTKGVTISHIVYGAYEALDEQNRAPIFDLTPLLDLLDWLSGAEALLRRSDAQMLAEKLRQTHRQRWQERTSDELPRRLQSIASKLSSLFQAFYLSRPLDGMKTANELLPMLDEALPEFERWAKPFRVIVEQVRNEIEPLSHPYPERLDAENLRKQLALIKHYLNKGLIAQAVMLAREWVVSWAILQRGEGDWLDKDYREDEIEKALGAAAARQRNQPAEVPDWFKRLPQNSSAAQLWDWLGQLRNDVAHCGMRGQAASAQSIEQRAKEIPQKLQALLSEVPRHSLWGNRVVIDLKTLYGEVAKLDELPVYLERVKELAGEGGEVVLTGQAPIWLYLAVAHALHGKARKLLYTSPTTDEILIFDHSAR